MSVSFRDKVNIDISQLPAVLTSFDTVRLSAHISLLDNSDKEITNQYISQIAYQWLYSSDNGLTYKSLPSDTSEISINVDQNNITYIYKLQLSILNPDYKVQVNQYPWSLMLQDGSILLTNQSNTINTSVWYSNDILIRHNIVHGFVNGMSEDSITNVVIVPESEEELLESPVSDDLEYNVDSNEESRQIESNLVLPELNYGADSVQNISQAQFLQYDCYQPISKSICGDLTVNMCRLTRKFGLFRDPSCLPANEILSQCKPQCTVATNAITIVAQSVGRWFNTNTTSGPKWCRSKTLQARGGLHDSFTLNIPEPPSAILCANNPAETNIPIYNNTRCLGEGLAIDNPRGGSAPPCPIRLRWIQGTIFGLNPLLGGYYEFPPPDANGQYILGPPCKGPGTMSAQYDVRTGKWWTASPSFSCNDQLYFKKSYCECDGEKIYGGDCNTPAVCNTLEPPVLSYEGEGISVSVYADEDGNLTTIAQELPVAPGSSLLNRQSITLTLNNTSGDNNHTAPPTIIAAISRVTGNTECDLYAGLNTVNDKWGPCLQPINSPCITSQESDIFCYDGDDYFERSGGGTEVVQCANECLDNNNYTNATPEVAVFTITAVTNRPTAAGQYKTLDRLLQELANENQNQAYIVKIQDIDRPSRNDIQYCAYTCQDRSGTQVKSLSLGNRAILGNISTSKFNICSACGCRNSTDCLGDCDICVGGKCISPFEPGHPCQDPVNETCCVAYSTLDPNIKSVTCADRTQCTTCQPDTSALFSGDVAKRAYIIEIEQDCCNGIIFDKQCKKCENNTIVNLCEPPEICDFIEVRQVPSLDDPSVVYDLFVHECRIPPCPPCERAADDYDTTGTCVPYNSTIQAKSECKTCEIEYDANGNPQEKITSTLRAGQTCCETIPGTEWTPAWVCCKDSTPYYVCSQGASCCGGECNDDNYCCVGGQKIPKDPCIGCDGEPYCPAGQICCYRSWDKAKGCANPSDCEECNTGFSAFGPVVRKVAALRQNPPDPCKECQNGEVVPITSADPDSPCYDPSEPQSIFFIP